jgi:hypothetical protein
MLSLHTRGDLRDKRVRCWIVEGSDSSKWKDDKRSELVIMILDAIDCKETGYYNFLK